MIIKSGRDQRSYEAVITANHPKARRGRAILLVNGSALSPEESAAWNFQVVSATEAERILLTNNGYLQAWSDRRNSQRSV